MVFKNGRGSFSRIICHWHMAKVVQERFEEHDKESIFPRSQSDHESVGYARQTKLIHGGLTMQFTELKGPAAIILVSGSTVVLWSPCFEGWSRQYEVLLMFG